ncbi:hypothetical protein BGX24_000916 [Mortierella sp. AD032]|nr:hypothetical protein BGX24_000916 [Mortierella sp. AD032]
MHFAKVTIASAALALIAITHAAPVDPAVPIDQSLIDPHYSESYYTADPEFALDADEENGALPNVNAIVQRNHEKAMKNGLKAMGLIPGIDDYSCKPSKDKPFPLVLVHGTAVYGPINWAYMAPRFALKGYCVFIVNYGFSPLNLLYGMDKMEDSAQELKVFIDNVLEKTGAKKVDIVGYSQGTLMPRYYQRYLGGAQKINKYTGFGSIQSGTTLSGLRTFFEKLDFFNKIKGVLSPLCEACFEMEHKSDWLQKMNQGRNTEAGVKYDLIMSKFDEVVTPYTNGILNATVSDPGQVRMHKLQDYCSIDLSEHILVSYDPIVFQLINSFLDPHATQRVNCWNALK